MLRKHMLQIFYMLLSILPPFLGPITMILTVLHLFVIEYHNKLLQVLIWKGVYLEALPSYLNNTLGAINRIRTTCHRKVPCRLKNACREHVFFLLAVLDGIALRTEL